MKTSDGHRKPCGRHHCDYTLDKGRFPSILLDVGAEPMLRLGFENTKHEEIDY